MSIQHLFVETFLLIEHTYKLVSENWKTINM